MTLILPDKQDIDKKLWEMEDEDTKNYLKEEGYSDMEVEITVRNSRLLEEIQKFEDLLCEQEEIIAMLIEDGWKREEIESAMKSSKEKALV